MSVRFKYYLRGCGLGILVASLVFIVSLHAHGGAMSDEKAMQRASEQNDTSKESEKKAEEKKKTQDSQKKEEEKEKAQETEKEETKKEKVSITIKGGEVCREIAQDLQEKGLVKDAEDFRKYMQDHNYARYIRVGTFTLEKGMNYSEIAKVLTKK